jgi:hypothetical protein
MKPCMFIWYIEAYKGGDSKAFSAHMPIVLIIVFLDVNAKMLFTKYRVGVEAAKA